MKPSERIWEIKRIEEEKWIFFEISTAQAILVYLDEEYENNNQ